MGRLRPPAAGRTATATAALVVIAGALACLALVAALAVVRPFATDDVDRSAPVVLERILELEDFTAAEGEFTETVDLGKEARYLPSFLKGERVLASVRGNVRATVDFGSLDEDSITVDDDGRSIRLVLPEPVLRSADIEESSTKILSRDRGVLDRVEDFFSGNPVDDTALFEAAEQKVDAAAAASDLEERARANTERWLRTFLGAAGFEDVVISWASSPG